MTIIVLIILLIMIITTIRCDNIDIDIKGLPHNDNNNKQSNNSNSKCPICTRIIKLVIDLAKDRYFHTITT